MKRAEKRLAAPYGLLIDWGEEVDFVFEGNRYQAFKGDTIASALAANDQWILSRSFKYHRPRGILSMAGHDANTLVEVDGTPNVLADRFYVRKGIIVKAQNYLGNLSHDRLKILDGLAGLLSAGFYYRMFFRPKGIWQKVWEPFIRRMAGLGKVNMTLSSSSFDKKHLFYDVVVIGGGQSGMQAALKAADKSSTVLLIDENPLLGGALTYVGGVSNPDVSRQAVKEVEDRTNIEIMLKATCTGWFEDNWLAVKQDNIFYKIRAGEVVFACGGIEQPLLFRNNDLPGIMLGSAAQRLLSHYAVKPGKKAVIATQNNSGYRVALDLIAAGVSVEAVVDLRDDIVRSSIISELESHSVAILRGAEILEATPGKSKNHVSGIRVRERQILSGVKDQEYTYSCDLLCMCGGHMPAYQLPLQAGGSLVFDGKIQGYRIEALNNSIKHVGMIAGDYSDGLLERRMNGSLKIHPHCRGKDFIDFDEDLTVNDILETMHRGYDDIELIKRYSTIGMGPSQGRTSSCLLAQLVSQEMERPLKKVGVTTARPPASGEELGLLAGRRYAPERRSVLHHWHVDAGAHMSLTGGWWRPDYYGAQDCEEEAIQSEVAAVRQNVGLLDISPLGKIEVRGPDAAEFLNRVYTFSYTKQKVGSLRYLLMLGDQGFIMDDGIAARLAEDWFQISTTSASSDAIYRRLLWLNVTWQLDVEIINITSAYAAMNLAGPAARRTLHAICTGVDLDNAAFPFLGVREGKVANVTARICRVGFVGELSYEIYVPTIFGSHVWQELIDAGRSVGLVPFGLKALRALRLEKGHIIVGQDTDAISTPREVNMLWAVSRKKPFYIGARSMKIQSETAEKRRLVGFSLPAGMPVPEEAALVVENNKMIGNVTSAAYSEACHKVIGLARISAFDEARELLPIRLTDGSTVTATLEEPYFYDPEGKRQNI